MDPECLEKKFVVFENNMEFQVHQVEEHGKALSSREKRDALRVDTSYMYDEERRKKSERRRDGASSGGVSINARRAAFGHSLTSDRAEPLEQYWSTVLSMLNDSQTKLTAMRGSLQAYRALETPVGSLVQTVISLTSDGTGIPDYGSGDIIVQSLAEMLDGEKRSALQDAWAVIKVQPRAAAPQPQMRSVKNVAGNNRVWDNVARAASSRVINSHEHFPSLGARAPAATPSVPGSFAHSRATQGRIRTANGASAWAPTPTVQPSSTAFPPLGAAPRAAPPPAPRSVATPQSRGSRVPVSESAFPSLPSNSAAERVRAQKREILANSSRSPLVPAAPPSRWGARSTPAMSDDFPALGGMREAIPEEPPAQAAGKQRRKRVLMSNSGGGRM